MSRFRILLAATTLVALCIPSVGSAKPTAKRWPRLRRSEPHRLFVRTIRNTLQTTMSHRMGNRSGNEPWLSHGGKLFYALSHSKQLGTLLVDAKGRLYQLTAGARRDRSGRLLPNGKPKRISTLRAMLSLPEGSLVTAVGNSRQRGTPTDTSFLAARLLERDVRLDSVLRGFLQRGTKSHPTF